jgi:hypothetical protein
MTMLQSTISCPHCNALGQNPGGFCTSCGKALPTAAGSGPRVLGKNEIGSSGAARTLRSDELVTQAKKAAGALLAVAIMQAAFGTISVLALNGQLAGRQLPPTVYAFIYGVAVIFLALYFWARKSPLPAAIVGLVVFITIHLLDAIADPASLAQGIIFKIIIIVVLARAIQSGLLYRKISAEQGVQPV